MAHAIFHSRFVSLALKAGLTVLAFWLVFRSIDVAQLREILAEQEMGFLLEAFALFGVQVMLGALRWHMILRALEHTGEHRLNYRQSLTLYYISVFFNGCLPGTVGGDVVRVWLAKARAIPLSLAIHSVVIDRVIALVALVILVSCTLPMVGAIFGFDAMWMGLATVAVILAIGMGMWTARWCMRYVQKRSHAGWLSYFVHSVDALWRHPRMSLASLMYAFISHVSYSLIAYVLAHSMQMELSLGHALALLPIVLLITTLPVSVGGWGVRELGMVGVLGVVGIAQPQAVLLGIEMGLVATIGSLPAGVLWLMNRREAQKSGAA